MYSGPNRSRHAPNGGVSNGGAGKDRGTGGRRLIGGDKSGTKRFYETMIPVADRLYDEYIEELRNEGLLP